MCTETSSAIALTHVHSNYVWTPSFFCFSMAISLQDYRETDTENLNRVPSNATAEIREVAQLFARSMRRSLWCSRNARRPFRHLAACSRAWRSSLKADQKLRPCSDLPRHPRPGPHTHASSAPALRHPARFDHRRQKPETEVQRD